MKRAPLVLGALLLGAGVVVGLWQWRASKALADEAKRRSELEYAARWDLDHGNPDQALEKVNGLLALEPGRPGLAGLKGRALVSTGAAAQGAQALSQVTAANPTDLEALEYLGVAQAQLGEAAAAKASLEKVVAADPSRTSAWRRLAQVQLAGGDGAAAAASWRSALRHGAAPELAQIRLEAKTLLEQAGRADDAALFAPESAP